jgi:hypothetical protein
VPTTERGRDCIDQPPDYGGPPMTIAYCVLAHRSPGQTRRLVNRLLSDDPDCLVLLHFDQRHATMDQTNVAGPRVQFLRERPIYWGCPEIVDVFVEMFNLALQAGCSHAVMLSGQDYPLRNVAGLSDELGAWDVWANMGPLFSNDGTCNWDEGRRRYTYEWYHVKEPKRAHKAADRVLAKLVRAKVSRRELPLPYLVHYRQRGQLWWGARRHGPGIPIYCGSMWMSLSARAMNAICSSSDRVSSFFHHVPIADEAYFHTVLANVKELTFAPNNARYIRWQPETESPLVLTIPDLQAATASGAHFARKFDRDVDHEVLDELDELSAQSMSS